MTDIDSLGRAVRRDTPLIDNVRQQIAQMCEMNQKPSKLRIDPRNWDVLVDEIIPLMPTYPVLIGPPKIFGLSIEFSNKPDFEVIE